MNPMKVFAICVVGMCIVVALAITLPSFAIGKLTMAYAWPIARPILIVLGFALTAAAGFWVFMRFYDWLGECEHEGCGAGGGRKRKKGKKNSKKGKKGKKCTKNCKGKE